MPTPITLSLLRIKNLALVEDLEWHIAPGFTAITGETGAGKSIIIGALQLLLGERADKSLIRTGTEMCTVEAILNGDGLNQLNSRLEQMGVEPADGELILKRTLTSAGLNRQFVNGAATTLTNLKALGDHLVDLHGPHDHQSLFSTDKQLELLDAFAGADAAREKFEKIYTDLRRLEAEHRTLNSSETALAQEIELLRHQRNEIAGANLSIAEETEIESRYRRASHSRRLIEIVSAALNRLSEADDAVLNQLAETQRLLRELEKLDPATEAIANLHESAVVELSEISRDLSRYGENLDLDPQRLAALETRVSLLDTLKRKYGPTLVDVIAFAERATQRLDEIERRDEELKELGTKIESRYRDLKSAGETLRGLRAAASPKLSQAVNNNLRDLGFEKSEFQVMLIEMDEARPSGFDGVELVFSPNPGEPVKPLRGIASSGEMSRLMLAIKTALASEDAIPLLIFDEIDANVGGEIAYAIGRRMRELGRHHQVLCITHLPQVAAAASSQFVVTKQVLKGRTSSQLEGVRGQEREEEIARMLGGRSEQALKLAAVMLNASAGGAGRRRLR